MASRFFPLLVAVTVVAALLASPSEATASPLLPKECQDTLTGLFACADFMFGGVAPPTPECCDAVNSILENQPLCLCYVIDGEFSKFIGIGINVTHALEIPALCGKKAPPVAICNSTPLPPLIAPPPHAAPAPSGLAPQQAPAPAPQHASRLDAWPPAAASDASHASSVAKLLLFASSIAFGVFSLF